jgi:hypothetical protein
METNFCFLLGNARVVGEPIVAWKNVLPFFPLKMYGYILESRVVGEPIAESRVVGEPSQSCRNLQVDTVFNKKTSPRDEAESFSRHRVLRHLLRSLPTILCGRCSRHIDVIFPIDQVVSDGVECVACDIDKVEFFFMLLDIPSEKHASSSWMYSLKVAPCHCPIF